MRDRDMGDFGRSVVPRCDATSSQQQAERDAAEALSFPKTYPRILMMQAGQDRRGDNGSTSLRRRWLGDRSRSRLEGA